MALTRLKKRIEFLRVAQAKCVAKTSTMLIQCDYSSFKENPEDNLRVGFTASRRVGNAVKRNRAKRRLRALTDQYLKNFVSKFSDECEDKKIDFVFIAVPSTSEADFQQLHKDFLKGIQWCLSQIHQKFLACVKQG